MGVIYLNTQQVELPDGAIAVTECRLPEAISQFRCEDEAVAVLRRTQFLITLTIHITPTPPKVSSMLALLERGKNIGRKLLPKRLL